MSFSGRSLSIAESEDDAEEKVRPLQRPQSIAVVLTPVSLAGQRSVQQMEIEIDCIPFPAKMQLNRNDFQGAIPSYFAKFPALRKLQSYE